MRYFVDVHHYFDLHNGYIDIALHSLSDAGVASGPSYMGYNIDVDGNYVPADPTSPGQIALRGSDTPLLNAPRASFTIEIEDDGDNFANWQEVNSAIQGAIAGNGLIDPAVLGSANSLPEGISALFGLDLVEELSVSVLDTTIAGRRLLETVIIPQALEAIFGNVVLPHLPELGIVKRALINAVVAAEKVHGSPVTTEYFTTVISQVHPAALDAQADPSQPNLWLQHILPDFGAQLPSDFRLLAIDSTTGAMAVAAPTDDSGKNNLVILTPFTNPISGGDSSVFRARVLEWPDDQPPLATAFEHALLSASSSASSQISDAGQGNSWSDDLPADDVEEIIFSQILGQSGAGPNGAPLGDDAYDAVFLIPQGFGPGKVAPFPYPAALDSATTESEVLAALSDVIAAINGIELPVIDFVPANDEGNFGIYSGGLNAVNGPQIAAFLLGLPLDHSFSDGVTLSSVLDGQVSVVSGLTLRIPDHPNLKEIARGTAPDGNGFIALIPESEDDSTVIWTLPGISAAVLNAVPSQIKIVHGGTETNLAELKPFGPTFYPADISGQQVDGTDLAEEIDASFTDANGDQLTGGHDTVFALDGDDTIHNSFGDDVIDGGAGHDTVYYGQFAFDGFWVEGDSTFVIEQEYASGRFEVDRLTNVERLSFADGSYATFTLGETSASITQYSTDGSQIIGLAERDWSPTGPFNARYQEFTNGVLTQFYLRQKDGLRIEKEFDSDGRKTMQRTRDGDDNFDWTYKLRQFQNSELTYSRTVYDDSTREELHFDSNGNVTFSEVQDERAETSWSSITKDYDSMGQLTRESIDYDNGDTVEKSFSNGVLSRAHFTDGDQSETWKTRSISYDSATGDITSKTVENHNGYYVSTIISGSYSSIYERDGSLSDGDNGNEPWRTKSTQFGPSGTLLSRTTTYDNGDETHYSYDYFYGTLQSIRLIDGDGSESWTEFQRTYDPSGALTSKSVVGSNGIRTTTSTNTYNGNVTITETDGDGAPDNTGIMPWQSKSITRTSDGTLHSKSTTFDNGDSVYRSYFSDGSVSSIRRTDGDNSESWKALEFNFNTDGSIQSRRIVEANGDSEHLYYNSDGSLSSRTLTDGDDSDSWTSLSYYYSATGDLDSVQINGENGAYEQKYFNASGDLIRFVQRDAYIDGLHNWQEITTNYDPDGTILTKLITFDNYGASASTVYNADGSRVVTAQDGSAHNSQHAWHTKVSTYAADGSLASVHRTMDSGEQTETGFDAAGNIISSTVFDHADAFVWSSKAKSFDAAGAQIGDTVTYDDGRISETTYVNGIRTQRVVTDTGDAVGWQTKTFDYNDTTGVLEQIIRLMDDGTSETESFLI